MTSRISLRKLIKKDCAQRSWLAIVMCVACAFLLPVRLLMQLQSVEVFYPPGASVNPAETAREVLEYKRSIVTGTLGGGNTLIIAGVIVAAMLAAFSGYAYLHSRSKVDFYHSIALRREKLFFVPFFGGALLTIVPYILCVLVSMAIAAGSGALTRAISGQILQTVGICVLSFFAVYALLILGMMLAGRIITGILLGFLFIGYGPLCWFLTQYLFHLSFQTYWGPSVSPETGLVLSPATLLLRMGRASAYGGAVPARAYILQVVYLAAGLALSLVFYRRRPSEAAGNALIHPRMHAFVKAVVTVPAALVAGMIFFMAQSTLGWFLAGSLIGAFLIGWALDAVFDRDVKGIFAHKVSGVIMMGITAAILVFLVADPTGYDRWVPEEDEVEAASIHTGNGMRELGSYYYSSVDGIRGMLDDSLTGDTVPVLTLAREGAANVQRFARNEHYVVDYAVPGAEADEKEQVVVCYKLKNGSMKYRQYIISSSAVREQLEALSEDAAWRRAAYPFAELRGSDLTGCTVRDVTSFLGGEGTEPALTARDQETLAGLIAEEGCGVSLGELSVEEPVACIDLVYDPWVDEQKRNVFFNTVYIYPQYEKTLRFLEEKGAALTGEYDPAGIAEQVLNLTVQDIANYDVDDSFTVTDAEDIRELLEVFRPNWTNSWDGTEEVLIDLTMKEGRFYQVSGRITDREAYEKLRDKYAGD